MIRWVTEPRAISAGRARLRIDERGLRAWVDGVLNRHPAVGLAVGIVRDGSLDFFHGHGLADIASSTRITEDTVFRIGSVTKPFTAISVMQLWEQGLVDLPAACRIDPI
jgi:CubicO group peptidase (beta-lactamase class C family)